MKPDDVPPDDVLQAALNKWQGRVKWYLLGSNWVVPNPKASVGRGKKRRAQQWAWIISTLRGALVREFKGSLERALAAFSSPEGRTKMLPAAAHSIADLLFEIAMRNPTAFRMIGEAFETAEKSDATDDPLVTAYLKCDPYSPKFDAELKAEFLKTNPIRCWNRNYRRTLRSYGFLLPPSKRRNTQPAEKSKKKIRKTKKLSTPKR